MPNSDLFHSGQEEESAHWPGCPNNSFLLPSPLLPGFSHFLILGPKVFSRDESSFILMQINKPEGGNSEGRVKAGRRGV